MRSRFIFAVGSCRPKLCEMCVHTTFWPKLNPFGFIRHVTSREHLRCAHLRGQNCDHPSGAGMHTCACACAPFGCRYTHPPLRGVCMHMCACAPFGCRYAHPPLRGVCMHPSGACVLRREHPFSSCRSLRGSFVTWTHPFGVRITLRVIRLVNNFPFGDKCHHTKIMFEAKIVTSRVGLFVTCRRHVWVYSSRVDVTCRRHV